MGFSEYTLRLFHHIGSLGGWEGQIRGQDVVHKLFKFFSSSTAEKFEHSKNNL